MTTPDPDQFKLWAMRAVFVALGSLAWFEFESISAGLETVQAEQAQDHLETENRLAVIETILKDRDNGERELSIQVGENRKSISDLDHRLMRIEAREVR